MKTRSATDTRTPTKPLTVYLPADLLTLVKTRAGLEGATLTSIVSEALGEYASGLQDVLVRRGFVKPSEGGP